MGYSERPKNPSRYTDLDRDSFGSSVKKGSRRSLASTAIKTGHKSPTQDNVRQSSVITPFNPFKRR